MDVLGSAGRLLASGVPPDELLGRLSPEGRRELARKCMRGGSPQVGDMLVYRIPTYHRWPMQAEAWRPALVVGLNWSGSIQLVVTLNPFEECARMRHTDSMSGDDQRDEYISILRRYGMFDVSPHHQPMFLLVNNGPYEGGDVGNWRWP